MLKNSVLDSQDIAANHRDSGIQVVAMFEQDMTGYSVGSIKLGKDTVAFYET